MLKRSRLHAVFSVGVIGELVALACERLFASHDQYEGDAVNYGYVIGGTLATWVVVAGGRRLLRLAKARRLGRRHDFKMGRKVKRLERKLATAEANARAPLKESRLNDVRAGVESYAAAGRILVANIAHQPPAPSPHFARQEDVEAFARWHTGFVSYLATQLDSPSIVGRFAISAASTSKEFASFREAIELWCVFLEETARDLRPVDVRPEPRTPEEAQLAEGLFGKPLALLSSSAGVESSADRERRLVRSVERWLDQKIAAFERLKSWSYQLQQVYETVGEDMLKSQALPKYGKLRDETSLGLIACFDARSTVMSHVHGPEIGDDPNFHTASGKLGDVIAHACDVWLRDLRNVATTVSPLTFAPGFDGFDE